MKLKTISTFLFALFLVGCANQTPTMDVTIPKPPKIVKEISPEVQKITVTNQKLEDKIKDQTKVIVEQKADIENAMDKAENIRKQLAESVQVKEQDAVDLILNLKSVHTRNLFLETQNTELGNINKQQATDLLEATKVAASKDSEVGELRSQSEFKDNLIKERNETVKTVTEERDKAIKQAASAKVYRNIIWGIAAAYILLTIVRNVLMAYGIKVRI